MELRVRKINGKFYIWAESHRKWFRSYFVSGGKAESERAEILAAWDGKDGEGKMWMLHKHFCNAFEHTKPFVPSSIAEPVLL